MTGIKFGNAFFVIIHLLPNSNSNISRINIGRTWNFKVVLQISYKNVTFVKYYFHTHCT